MYKYREGLGRWLSWWSDCLASLKTWTGFSERTGKAVWGACYLRTAKEPGGPRWTQVDLRAHRPVNATWVRSCPKNKQTGKKHARNDTWVNLWLPYTCVHIVSPMATHTNCIYKKKAARACHLDMAYNIGNKMQNLRTTVWWGQC